MSLYPTDPSAVASMPQVYDIGQVSPMPMMDAPMPTPMMAPPPPPPVDFSRVTNTILKFHQDNQRYALEQTKDVHERAKRLKRLYDVSALPTPSVDAAKQQSQDIQLPEAANQHDTVKGVFYANLFQNSQIWKGVACNGEKQERVDATKEVVDAQFRAKAVNAEFESFFHRFGVHPIAGMKACVELVDEPDYQRIAVPNNPMAIGAMQAEHAAMGGTLNFVAGPDENGELLYDSAKKVTRKYFYTKAVDILNLCFGDLKRAKIGLQPSIHELHVWNEDEIFGNPSLRGVDALGQPNANGRKHVPEQTEQTGQGENENAREWLVWESWGELPIQRWIAKGKFSPEEWQAFAEYHDFDPNEANIPQKWCVFHTASVKQQTANTSGLILTIYPNYLLDRQQYPYDMISYIDGDNELVGKSFLERLEPMVNLYNAVHAMYTSNLKALVYQSVLATDNSNITDKTLRDLRQPYGFAKLEGNVVEDQIIFMADHTPDVTNSAQAYLGLMQSSLQQVGAPAVIQGKGQSGTATQDTINNVRGQQKIDSPFRRAVMNVVKPQIEKVIGLTYRWFDTPQYIAVAGESGAMLAKEPKWVTPREITNRIEVVPLATFDFADRPVKAQQLMATLNIAAPIVPPPVALRLLGRVLEYQGESRETINEITNNFGLGTDPEMEMQTILLNPHEEIRVRPDDNHELALMTADKYRTMFPPIEGQPNFQKYVTEHTVFLQQQQAMAAMGPMGPPNGPPDGPQGKPQQAPKDGAPQNREGVTKQNAQHESTPDGGMSQVGMTGRGGMAARTGMPSRVTSLMNQAGAVTSSPQ